MPQPSTTGGAGTRSSGVASSVPGPAAAAAAAKEQTSEQQPPAAAQPHLSTGSVKPDEAASPRHKPQAGSPAKKQRGAGEEPSAEAAEGKGHEVGAQTKSVGQASSPVDEAPAAKQAAPAASPAKTAAAGPASKEEAAPVGDVDMAEATQASSCPATYTCPSCWLLCRGPRPLSCLKCWGNSPPVCDKLHQEDTASLLGCLCPTSSTAGQLSTAVEWKGKRSCLPPGPSWTSWL